MEIANERYAGESPLSESPNEAVSLIIDNNAVTSEKIAPGAVTSDKLDNKAVTSEKLGDDVKDALVTPVLEPINREISEIDNKYNRITNELYSMIRSLQVGGIALSGYFGDREDIGIHQKALTNMYRMILHELEEATGKTYIMDYIFTVNPTSSYADGPATIFITADARQAVSPMSSIQFYINDELIEESSDVRIFSRTHEITESCTVKAIGVIMGQSIVKTVSVTKEIPFFIGSGNVYTDVMNSSCWRQLDGSLEGDYDLEVKNVGEKMFIIIPISKKEEFRRCTLDMNGFEIPMTVTEITDYIVCESMNTYKKGIYNIDININS